MALDRNKVRVKTAHRPSREILREAKRSYGYAYHVLSLPDV